MAGKYNVNGGLKNKIQKEKDDYFYANFHENKIFLRSRQNQEEYKNLKSELQNWIKDNSPTYAKVEDIQQGNDEMYLVKLRDKGPERAKIKRYQKNMCYVYLIDLGVFCNLFITEILDMPTKFKECKSLVEEFYLNNFKVNRGTLKEVTSWLRIHLFKRPLTIEKILTKKTNRCYVNIYMGSKNLVEELVENGMGNIFGKDSHAVMKFDANSAHLKENNFGSDQGFAFKKLRAVNVSKRASCSSYSSLDQAANSYHQSNPMSYDQFYDDPSYYGPLPSHDSSSLDRGSNGFQNMSRPPLLDHSPHFSLLDYPSRNGSMLDSHPHSMLDRHSRESMLDYRSNSLDMQRDSTLDYSPRDLMSNSRGPFQRSSQCNQRTLPPNGCSPNYNAELEEGREQNSSKEISILKGHVKAYEQTLMDERRRNFARQPNQSLNLVKKLMKKRELLQPLLSDQRGLVTAINYLKQDAHFHKVFDSIVQEGNDLMELCKKIKDPENYQIVKKINRFLEMAMQLDIGEICRSLEIMFSRAKECDEALSSPDALSCFGVNARDYILDDYSALGRKFLIWKADYSNLQTKSDSAISSLVKGLQEFSKLFADVKSDSVPENPDIDFQNLSDVFLEESRVLREIHIVPSTLKAVSEEIEIRLSKAKKALTLYKSVNDLNSVNPLSLGRTPSPSELLQNSCERGYPSLFKFIGRSQSMSSRTKLSIVSEVFKQLISLHNRNGRYGFLTPDNILLKFEGEDGAVLSPLESANQYEPALPFRFLAPELNIRSVNFLHETTFSYNEIVSNALVDCSMDFYSLGRIILWLARIDHGDNFYDEVVYLQRQNPLLSAMTSSDPKARPSVKVLQRDLQELLLTVFPMTTSNLSTSGPTASALDQGNASASKAVHSGESNQYSREMREDIELAKKLRQFSNNHPLKTLDDSPNQVLENVPNDTNSQENSPEASRESPTSNPSEITTTAAYEEAKELERQLQQKKELQQEAIMLELMDSDGESDHLSSESHEGNILLGSRDYGVDTSSVHVEDGSSMQVSCGNANDTPSVDTSVQSQ